MNSVIQLPPSGFFFLDCNQSLREDKNHNIIITIIIRVAWWSLARSFKDAMAEISWGNGLRLTLIKTLNPLIYIWSLKYTSILEIHHFLPVFISIAYNGYETCKVRKEITRNKTISLCLDSIISNTTDEKKT